MDSMWCSGCVGEAEFERFDCADHGPDCPEFVCVGCGAGVELAPPWLPAAAPAAVSPAA